MALSPKDALEAAMNILRGPRLVEFSRLERLHEAMQPCRLPGQFRASVQIPEDAPPLMRELARKSDTNYLPLLVKTFGQVMKADGYYSETDPGATEPWTWWQRNRMDSRQTGVVRSALHYGAAYATALPGTYGRDQSGPAISLYSPREMTALYQDPESDEWPMLALGVNNLLVTMLDEEMSYTFGIEPGPLPYSAYRDGASVNPNAGYGYGTSMSTAYGPGLLTFIEAKAHNLGVCPVIRYRDRNLLSGEESLGIVEPLLNVQERINETTFDLMVHQYFQAFKQRYVIGWVPKGEQEELKAGAARIWYLDEDPKDVTIGSLEEGNATSTLEFRNSAIRDFAAIGQIPAQALGVDGISNISDATLAGLEAAKNREANEITTSLGESHEQLLRLCAYIDGNESAADDYSSEIRWRDMESRSYAQTIDGLGKLVTMLGLDPAIALEDVPGMTEQRLERAQASLRRGQGAAVLDALAQRGQQSGQVAPDVSAEPA